MVFSSMIFLWIFFPIVFMGNFILYKIGNFRLVNFFLLIASLFFYAWGEPLYVFLMVFTVYCNWKLGLALEKSEHHRNKILVVTILLNLALLGWFKYAGMLVSTFCTLLGITYVMPEIPLPIGISFFTFQALSYVIDVYRGECKGQKSFSRLLLYVSFFPQLIAGPIVKYKDVEAQIEKRALTVSKTAEGIRRFSYGLGKKVLIANVLAAVADSLYGLGISEVSSPMVWVASLCYTFQIYYDFSGYSDMAIGLGKMFGFDFKENFNYPYISFSIREFWRRWHISLSSWFREYVYISLGGSRKGKLRTYRNLLLVFFLTGLWHGASWNFVFWGMFHGAFLVIERVGIGKLLEKQKILAWIYTFIVVHFGWVFFRIEDIKEGFAYLKRMVLPWRYMESGYSLFEFIDGRTLLSMGFALVGMGVFQHLSSGKIGKKLLAAEYLEIAFCTVILCFSLISLTGNTYNPFIYFRF